MAKRLSSQEAQGLATKSTERTKGEKNSIILSIRWIYPKHFPYRIIYLVDDRPVKVIAVMHATCQDAAWHERVDSNQ